MDFEAEQLLSEKQQTHDNEQDATSIEAQHSWPRSKQRSSLTWLSYQALVHVLLFVSIIYIGGTHHFWINWARETNNYRPATDGIEFYNSDINPLSHHHSSIYSGAPTKENIAAWDALVEPTFVTVSEKDLIRSGASPDRAVRFAEHENYFVGGSGVYHHIHCLRRLRWWVYQDHFYPNMTQENIDVVVPHLGHCIEALRFTLMCNPDLDFYSYEWDDPKEDRPEPKTWNTRQCVKWDSLDKWSRDRSVGFYPWLLRPDGEAESVHMV